MGSIVSDIFGGGSDDTRDAAGQVQFNPFDITLRGLGTTQRNGNSILAELDPQLRSIANSFEGLSRDFLGGAGRQSPFLTSDIANQALEQGQQGLFQTGSFNPLEAANEQFNQLEEILQPGRDEARASNEARLFSQGRLDSTGGSRQLRDFEQGIERERSANLLNIFNNAQDSRSQSIADASQQIGLGTGLFNNLFDRSISSLQAATGTRQIPLDLVNQSISAGGGGLAASQTRADLLAQAGQQQAGATSNLFGGLLGGLNLFSDRKFKKNIKKVDEINGLNVYEFEYNREYLPKGVHVGVMSDEVVKVVPDAVIKCNGFDLVDYSKVSEYARAA